MSSWTTARNRERRRRTRTLSCETLEGRVLLSNVPTVMVGTPRPIDTAVASRHERRIEIASSQGAPSYPMPVPSQTIDAQGKFAYDTFNRGVTMAKASPVRKVGLSYAKLTVAHDTTKVGAAYLHAVVRGDGKEINQLSRTRLVHKVAKDFTSLSHSSAVRHVGHAFAKFGNIVSDQWSQYFGPKHSKPATHKS